MIGVVFFPVACLSAQVHTEFEKDPKFWITSTSVLLSLAIELKTKPIYLSAEYFKSEESIFLIFEAIDAKEKRETRLFLVQRSGYVERELLLNKLTFENNQIVSIDGKKVMFVRRLIGNTPIN